MIMGWWNINVQTSSLVPMLLLIGKYYMLVNVVVCSHHIYAFG